MAGRDWLVSHPLPASGHGARDEEAQPRRASESGQGRSRSSHGIRLTLELGGTRPHQRTAPFPESGATRTGVLTHRGSGTILEDPRRPDAHESLFE